MPGNANIPSKKVATKKDSLASELPPGMSAPAIRALLNEKITTLRKLATFTEQEILSLHGMGPSSMPKLRAALKKCGLSFKKK